MNIHNDLNEWTFVDNTGEVGDADEGAERKGEKPE